MAGNLNKKSRMVRQQINALMYAIALLIPVWGQAAMLSGGSTSSVTSEKCNSLPSEAAQTACLSALASGGGALTGSNAQALTKKAQPGLPPEQINPSEKNPPQTQVEEKNDFQEFVAQSVGSRLPIYGHNLFFGEASTFAPVDNIPVTPDYLIGPGDELVIKGWGGIDIDFTSVVNRNGTVDLPKVGSIKVAGVRYQDLQHHLKNAIGKVYRNFELNISLGRLRSIQVFVVGQAKQPGVYTISSLSTLVNTLFVSGGPSSRGSLRHIQVKRNGENITELDLYDFLLKGDKSKDISLMPGDVIYIPPAGQLVAIYGGINTPGIYELKGEKTTLGELLELSGGMTTTAKTQNVLLERIEERKVRKVEELQLDNAGLAHLLKDGDLVHVRSLGPRFENAVTLRGNVAEPGRYPWKTGMRISDLIPDRQVLLTPDYWLMQNRATQRDVAKDRAQGQDQLRNEIKHDVSEINWEYALIERLNSEDLTTQLIPFNLGNAIAGDVRHNMELQPGDLITIFSQRDIQVPIASRSVYVLLEGETASAGVYKALPGETLRGLLKRVGGFTPNAFLFGAEFDRESVRALQQKKLDEMLDKMEQGIRRNLAGKERGALSAEDAASGKAAADAQLAVVAKMREAKATGRVVLEINEDNNGKVDELPDIALEDGDRLMVPAKPSVVSVMGMVYNENAFMYKPGKRVADYLDQAGGPTRDADKERIYLLRADGSVASAQNSNYLFFFNSFASHGLQPGDAIIVPELLDKFQFTKELKDWTQIFYQFALGVTSIKVLRM